MLFYSLEILLGLALSLLPGAPAFAQNQTGRIPPITHVTRPTHIAPPARAETQRQVTRTVTPPVPHVQQPVVHQQMPVHQAAQVPSVAQKTPVSPSVTKHTSEAGQGTHEVPRVPAVVSHANTNLSHPPKLTHLNNPNPTVNGSKNTPAVVNRPNVGATVRGSNATVPVQAHQNLGEPLTPVVSKDSSVTSRGVSSIVKTNYNPRVHRPQDTVKYDRPSYLSSKVTLRNITEAHKNFNSLRNNPQIVDIVNAHGASIIRDYDPLVKSLFNVYGNYYHNPAYNLFYSHWYRLGFYGGYYYPVRPCYDINSYFYYPMVFWLYNSEVDPLFYAQWYSSDAPTTPFPYARVYYPTDTVRDLAIDLSGTPSLSQSNFRTGILDLSQALDGTTATGSLGENQVVVNHYENLSDKAIVIEGFVDVPNSNPHLASHVAFKALIDLDNPKDSSKNFVVAPLGTDPKAAEEVTLGKMNDRIVTLGGNPFVAAEEPVQ